MIESGVCRTYKVDVLRGIHSEDDTYYMALYTDAANIGPQTERYSPNGEIVGSGYEQGGKKIDLRVVSDAYGAAITFDEQVWEIATIAANGSMIYNASKGNRAVAVMAFAEEVSSVNGKFTVKSDSGQLIRII